MIDTSPGAVNEIRPYAIQLWGLASGNMIGYWELYEDGATIEEVQHKAFEALEWYIIMDAPEYGIHDDSGDKAMCYEEDCIPFLKKRGYLTDERIMEMKL